MPGLGLGIQARAYQTLPTVIAPAPVEPTPVMSAGFEGGDLSGWSVTGAGHLSVTARAALNGSAFGLEVNLTPTLTANHVERAVSMPASGTFVLRFRFHTENADPSYASQRFGEIRSSVGTLLRLNWERRDFVWRIWGSEGDDLAGYIGDTIFETYPGGHELTVEVYRGSSAVASDGHFRYYLDGALVGERTGVDLYDKAGAITGVRLGVLLGATDAYSGRYYLDDVRVHDSRAGLIDTPTTRSTVPATLFADGFEAGDTSAWHGGESITAGGSAVVQTGTKRSGTYACALTLTGMSSGSDSAIRLFNKPIAMSHPVGETRYYGAWLYLPEHFSYTGTWGHANIWQFKLRDGSTFDDAWYTLRLGERSGANYLYLKREHVPGYPETIVTFPDDVPTGAWFHIEVAYEMKNGGDGSVVVLMDGVEQARFDNTRTFSAAPNAHMQWSINNYTDLVSPSPNALYLDDVTVTTHSAY